MNSRKSIIWTLKKEDLQKVLDKYSTYKEVLQYFGLSYTGGSFRSLKKRIKEDDLNCSKYNLSRKENFIYKTYTNDEVFIKDSDYGRGHLKNRIIKQNLIPYKCAICGLEHSWNGKELVLILDHINGINNDNRLENLRFLCPNCNSQEDTFAGRNNGSKKNEKVPTIKLNHCEVCGTLINKGSLRCAKCEYERRKENYRGVRPSKEQLIQDILTLPLVKVGRKYGVSDNAVRKWCKSYTLPVSKKEIQMLKQNIIK